MNPNSQTGKYELLPHERVALGLAVEQSTWPMHNPTGLLELAQVRLEEITLQESANGTQEGWMAQSERLWRQSGYIRQLITQLEPDLPADDGFSEFLQRDTTQ